MKSARPVVILIGLGIIVVAEWGLRQVYLLYSAADPNVKLGVLTAFGSAAAFVINNVIQNSRERRSRLFESKREAYAGFFRLFMSIFHRVGSDHQVEMQEMVQGLRALSTDLMIWGSADAINTFNSFAEQSALHPDAVGYELYDRTEKLMRALRRDLGHSDSALSKFGLTKLIIRGNEHRMLDALTPTNA